MSGENAESFETFESFDGEGDESDTFDNLPEVDEEEVEESDEDGKDKVKEDLKVIKNSKADSEGKVIKEDGEKEEKSKKEKKDETFDDEEEEEESEEETSEETTEEESDDKTPKTKIRMRMGNELYNVDSTATLPVKIDGKIENVPVQELLNNYSGKTAWDKKFTEIGKEKKQIELQTNAVAEREAKLQHHVKEAIAPLKDPSKNPMDSLLYLVEMSGEDPYNAYRRIMEANLDELSNLMDMSETERELHFHKKKDELYGKVARKRQASAQEEERFNQLTQKVDSLRQSRNVSEEDFVDASEELEEAFKASGLNPETISEEDVVDFASLRPHIATVRELVEPYAENISEEKYGDVVAQLSKYLRDGKLDKKGVAEALKRNFSVEEEVKELNTKVYQKGQAKKPSKVVAEDSSKYESFDDWE